MPIIEKDNVIPNEVAENVIINNDNPSTQIKNSLSDSQIDDVVKAAESERLDTPSVEVNPDAELEVGISETVNGKFIGVTGTGAKSILETITTNEGELDNENSNKYDFDAAFGCSNNADSDAEAAALTGKAIDATANAAKDTFDLSDEEVFRMVEVLNAMKSDPKYPVYANLPEKLQLTISKLAYDNKVPPTKLNEIARAMMEEFVSQAGVDQSLIDLEVALDEALKIPSVVDMYAEHTVEVMDKIMPETIANIKDEFPEEAAKMEAIRTSFHDSYNYERIKAAYATDARVRKAIRRFDSEYDRCITRFNYMHEKTRFKMHDVSQILDILKRVFITDAEKDRDTYLAAGEEIPVNIQKLLDLNVTEDDIKKFIILFTKSCENMNASDAIDAAYMYYTVRNIMMLGHTTEAKTNFAAELINNICDCITFIRDKESEFRESNMVKSKQSKKRKS